MGRDWRAGIGEGMFAYIVSFTHTQYNTNLLSYVQGHRSFGPRSAFFLPFDASTQSFTEPNV